VERLIEDKRWEDDTLTRELIEHDKISMERRRRGMGKPLLGQMEM
jgi:hypothetical protein